MSIEARNA